LGNYQTGAVVSEGEQGFPVYVDGQFLATLAHPSGWAVGQDGEARLRNVHGYRTARLVAQGTWEGYRDGGRVDLKPEGESLTWSFAMVPKSFSLFEFRP
jgi:hypothetical protein